MENWRHIGKYNFACNSTTVWQTKFRANRTTMTRNCQPSKIRIFKIQDGGRICTGRRCYNLLLEVEHTVSTIWTIGAVHLLTQLTDARSKKLTPQSVCQQLCSLWTGHVLRRQLSVAYVRDRMKRSLRTELHCARVPLFIALHSRPQKLGTCESFFSFESNLRIESAVYHASRNTAWLAPWHYW